MYSSYTDLMFKKEAVGFCFISMKHYKSVEFNRDVPNEAYL